MSLGNYPATGWDASPSDADALIGEILGWIRSLEDIARNLPELNSNKANEKAWKGHQKYCHEIAKKMTRYVNNQRQQYYHLFFRSEGAFVAAQTVIDSAVKAAKLFEHYRKVPDDYSEVDADLSLDALYISLENLQMWLSAYLTNE